MNQSFEEVKLEHAAFDLGTSATAFHWLDDDRAAENPPSTALRRLVGSILKHRGDVSRADPFMGRRALPHGRPTAIGVVEEMSAPDAVDGSSAGIAMCHVAVF